MGNKTDRYTIPVDELNEGFAIFRYREGTGRLDYANRVLRERLHFELDTLRGASYEELLEAVDARDVAEVRAFLQALPKTKTGTSTYRIADFGTGEQKWLAARGMYLQDENGPVAYFTFTDVSLLKETIARERRLTSCLQLITGDGDFTANIRAVMACVLEQYRADRSYIFEFDWDSGLMHNTYEEVAPGVRPEIDSLQQMDVNLISYWLPKFRAGEPVFIDDLENLLDEPDRRPEYDVLVVQDIHSLMVVPIAKGDKLFGYIGVDNPAFNMPDKEFLNNVAFILGQEYLARLQQSQLEALSLADPLTGLNNRHAYNQTLDALEGPCAPSAGIGTIFTDVNALKYVNDNYGHIEGDRLILRAADVLKEHFGAEHIYRISGDEFVAIVPDVAENPFADTVEKLRLAMSTQYGTIFAVGQMWRPAGADVQEMLREAEEKMYADKEHFYEKNPRMRRGLV